MSVQLALSTRDKLQELSRFLDRNGSEDELDPPLVAILNELQRNTRTSAQALGEYLTRGQPPASTSAPVAALNSARAREDKEPSRPSRTSLSRKRSRAVSEAPADVSAPLPANHPPSAKRARTAPDRLAQLPTSRGHRAPMPVTPAEKQEKKVQRLMQQCANLKERAETAEHSLKSSVAKQRKRLQKSKDTERATMLSTVARICERSRRQVPLRDGTEQKSKQELAQDQRTLSEAWECIRSPTDARQSAQSMESAQAIEHYNRHAALGRKMSLRARFICGLLAARFWDGTNAAGAKQERERVDAATASNFEKWCAAGHLHTSMKVMLSEIRFALVCDLFPGILSLVASEFPWTLFAEHSASWLDAFRQAASQPGAPSEAPMMLLEAAELSDGKSSMKADENTAQHAVEPASLFDGSASTAVPTGVILAASASPTLAGDASSLPGHALAAVYFQPRHLGDEYVWDELQIVDVPGKGQGVRARMAVPKGKCLPVHGLEIPDDPYPEDTRYILDVGKKGFLLDVNPLHAPDHQRGLFIAGKVNEPSRSKRETANMVAVFDDRLQRAVFKAVEDIATGQELLVDYGRYFDRSDRAATATITTFQSSSIMAR